MNELYSTENSFKSYISPESSAPMPNSPLQPQDLPRTGSYTPFIFLPIVSPYLGCVDVGTTFVVRLSQHAHNTDQNFLHTLYRRPPLTRVLVLVWVIAR